MFILALLHGQCVNWLICIVLNAVNVISDRKVKTEELRSSAHR